MIAFPMIAVVGSFMVVNNLTQIDEYPIWYYHIYLLHYQVYYQTMQQIGQSESLIFDNSQPEQNQFLMEYLQYQSCPFCNRSFFRGKLTYHLKHCSNTNPMIKSNKPSPRHIKNSYSAATNYQRCVNCNSRIPSFLVQKHNENCSKMSETKMNKSKETKDPPRNQVLTAEETIFPKIRNYASQDHAKTSKRITLKPNGPTVIKIREELRCFRIAEQVQKIQCHHCGRKFSQQASQRHIPICSLLKEKQIKEIVNIKDQKNQTKKQRTRLLGLGKSLQVIETKLVEKEQQYQQTKSVFVVEEGRDGGDKKKENVEEEKEKSVQKQEQQNEKVQQSSKVDIIKVEQK